MISTLMNRRLAKALVVFVLLSSQLRAESAPPPPVFWNVFEVKASGDSVTLDWLVTEYNNKSFWVEHSTDGMNWYVIATIPSKRSLESLEDYHFAHANRQEGKHYYRIKHQDINDYHIGFSMTRVINITKEVKTPVRIIPNPATDHIYVNNTSGDYSWFTILDLSGRIIMQNNLPKQNKKIDLTSLAPGNYIIMLGKKEGSDSFRFIKM